MSREPAQWITKFAKRLAGLTESFVADVRADRPGAVR